MWQEVVSGGSGFCSSSLGLQEHRSLVSDCGGETRDRNQESVEQESRWTGDKKDECDIHEALVAIVLLSEVVLRKR